eukprot:6480475-Alexandrium_andersonii.AAC.1
MELSDRSGRSALKRRRKLRPPEARAGPAPLFASSALALEEAAAPPLASPQLRTPHCFCIATQPMFPCA